MSHEPDSQPLTGVRITTLAVNVPGPVAAARLRELGAEITKVEPPTGDQLFSLCPAWYESLVAGQKVLRLNLKDEEDRAQLDQVLAESDVLLTSMRPSALTRLSLEWADLHARFPRLCQVAIIGYPAPNEDKAGHDLTYQAEAGLVAPPDLPRTLLADLMTAERAVSAALALLVARGRDQLGRHAEVALVEAAKFLAEPVRHCVTTPNGALGGGFPGYNLYRARRGWVALAALETHFWRRMQNELGLSEPTGEDLARVFLTRNADEWEAWAVERDLPLVAVRETTPVNQHIFTYGTLMFPEVWQAVVGRPFETLQGTLRGYAIYRVKDEVFPGITAACADDAVEGVIYLNVDERALQQLDRFEDEFFLHRETLSVDCIDGLERTADAYVVPAEHRNQLTNERWSSEEFLARGDLQQFVAQFEGFSRLIRK